MKPSFWKIAWAAACWFWAGQPVHAITLTVLLLSNASTEKPLQQLLAQYSREHPEVTFDVSVVQYGAALTAKINTLLAAMMWTGNWELKTLVEGGTRFPFGTTCFPRNAIRAACPGGEFFIGFARSPHHDEAAKLMLWWAQPSITRQYLESLGGSLLSPMKDVPVNYGKYAAYLKPMIDDLAATPPWVAEDLARPEMNRLQDDLLDQLILYSTGRTSLEAAISNMKNLGAELLESDRARGK